VRGSLNTQSEEGACRARSAPRDVRAVDLQEEPKNASRAELILRDSRAIRHSERSEQSNQL
jgi:hypothetical protein